MGSPSISPVAIYVYKMLFYSCSLYVNKVSASWAFHFQYNSPFRKFDIKQSLAACRTHYCFIVTQFAIFFANA